MSRFRVKSRNTGWHTIKAYSHLDAERKFVAATRSAGLHINKLHIIVLKGTL